MGSHVNVWIVNQFANQPDQPGGTRQYEFARHLVARGHKATVIASDFNTELLSYRATRPGRPLVREVVNGVEWLWLYATPYRTNDWRRYLNLASFCVSLLAAAVRLKAPDVIVGSSPQLPATYVAWLIARLRGSRFVFEVRDLWPQVLVDMAGKPETDAFVRLLRSFERTLYRRSDAVVVLARGAIEYVVARGVPREKTFWLPNSVDAGSFEVATEPAALRRRYGLPPDRFVAVYAGAHGDANALHVVVEAARLLVDAPEIHLALFGDGPTKERLLASAEGLPNCSFHDAVPNTAVPQVLAAADAGMMLLRDVALFRYGVSPRKLYDYFAAGRPVIAAVGGDVNLEVEQEGVGFTADPEDAAGLAAAIRACAAVPASERQAIGCRARSLARERYDRLAVTEAFEHLIMGLSS
jgi:glycosyltransferase involved in cell wall biosynthesis